MATKDVTEANITWGNLVDLSDGTYGLGNVTLSPARLNLQDDGSLGTTILNAPSYGSDGRVINVNTATYTGKFTDAGTYVYDELHKGVRIIGTTTDVSQRLAAYRSAKAAVTSNINSARTKGPSSLANNGQDLANILVGYVSDENITFTYAELRVLLRVLTALEEATENAETAIKSAVLANSLSANNNNELDDTAVAALVNDIGAVSITSSSSFDGITNVVVPEGLSTAITTYVGLHSTISDAMDTLNGTNGLAPGLTLTNTDTYADADGSFSYSDISPVFNDIIDKTNVEVGGVQNPSSADLNAIVQYYIKNNSISIVMLDGSGVYAELAKLVDNFTASGFTVRVTHSSVGTVDVPVSMSTSVSGDTIPQISKIVYGAQYE